jgi:ABC-type polysaccharide transport system permease subunit
MLTLKKKKKNYRLLLMAAPFLLMVVLFNYVPLFGWSFAFFEYRLGLPIFQSEFVGLRYFIMFLTDRVNMLRVMRNTAIFSLITLALTPLPMIFAILLSEIKSVKFKKVVQTFTTVPNFVSWVIVFSLAFMIFSTDGLLNQILAALGITPPPTVLGNRDAVYWFQSAMTQWKTLGWSAIIYFAALAGIDQEMYEAAAIDGANRLHNILYITIPSLMPTYLVLLLLAIGNFVNLGVEQYFVFENPMVANNIEVLDLYVLRVGLVGNDFSFGTAIGIMRSVVSVSLLFTANAIAKKIRGNSIV